MTLEETTSRMLAAAEAEDLGALLAALKDRESAIAALASIQPTVELRNAVEASIAAGEEARRAIRAIKQRIRTVSRRLANIEGGFLRVLTPVKHQIDCKG
jgi:hypothetical protein